MSELMKKPLINVSVGDSSFSIPRDKAKALLELVKGYDRAGNVSLDVVYKENFGKRPKGSVILKGARHKLGLSQKDVENETGISVTNISKYENGSRKITKNIAKKFSKVLDIDDKLLLK